MSVPDLNLEALLLGVLLDVDVDREMRIDVSHLIFKPLGNADHEVVDESPNGPEGCHVLTVAMVDLNGEHVRFRLRKRHGDVAQVLLELAWKIPNPGPLAFQVLILVGSHSRVVFSQPPSRLDRELDILRTSGALNRHKPRLDGELDCRNRVSISFPQRPALQSVVFGRPGVGVFFFFGSPEVQPLPNIFIPNTLGRKLRSKHTSLGNLECFFRMNVLHLGEGLTIVVMKRVAVEKSWQAPEFRSGISAWRGISQARVSTN
jgi:hypothetical protein